MDAKESFYPASHLLSWFQTFEAFSYRRNVLNLAWLKCLHLWASWTEMVHFPSESICRHVIRIILGTGHCIQGWMYLTELPWTQTTAPQCWVNTNLTVTFLCHQHHLKSNCESTEGQYCQHLGYCRAVMVNMCLLRLSSVWIRKQIMLCVTCCKMISVQTLWEAMRLLHHLSTAISSTQSFLWEAFLFWNVIPQQLDDN